MELVTCSFCSHKIQPVTSFTLLIYRAICSLFKIQRKILLNVPLRMVKEKNNNKDQPISLCARAGSLFFRLCMWSIYIDGVCHDHRNEWNKKKNRFYRRNTSHISLYDFVSFFSPITDIKPPQTTCGNKIKDSHKLSSRI